MTTLHGGLIAMTSSSFIGVGIRETHTKNDKEKANRENRSDWQCPISNCNYHHAVTFFEFQEQSLDAVNPPVILQLYVGDRFGFPFTTKLQVVWTINHIHGFIYCSFLIQTTTSGESTSITCCRRNPECYYKGANFDGCTVNINFMVEVVILVHVLTDLWTDDI